MLRTAAEEGVKYILAGTNFNTESILPRAWSHGHADWGYIRGIQRRFGRLPLKTYPHRTMFQTYYYRAMKKIRWISLLDYVDYVKDDAKKLLIEELQWEDYGGKHFESIYTRFFQGYILPAKFGFDKRKAHLSSLIVAKQITRDQALDELRKPPYDEKMLHEDTDYVLSKFELSEADFRKIMETETRRFADYPSYENALPRRIVRALRKRMREQAAAQR
jgi:hypothetical protein